LPKPEKDGEKGVMFFDDVCQAYPSTQNTVSQIVLDHQAGIHEIPTGWRNYILASNEAVHRAAIHELPSHLANRVTHIKYEVDLDDWKEWAFKNGVVPEVVSYLNYCEHGGGSKVSARLYNDFGFKERAFATPRTWEMASDDYKRFHGEENLLQEVLAGDVGAGIAAEFIGFLRVFDQLPDPVAILEGRETSVPTDSSQLYALCGALVNAYLKDPLKYGDPMLGYSRRLSQEWAAGLLIRDAYRADRRLVKAKAWPGWARDFSNVVLP